MDDPIQTSVPTQPTLRISDDPVPMSATDSPPKIHPNTMVKRGDGIVKVTDKFCFHHYWDTIKKEFVTFSGAPLYFVPVVWRVTGTNRNASGGRPWYFFHDARETELIVEIPRGYHEDGVGPREVQVEAKTTEEGMGTTEFHVHASASAKGRPLDFNIHVNLNVDGHGGGDDNRVYEHQHNSNSSSESESEIEIHQVKFRPVLWAFFGRRVYYKYTADGFEQLPMIRIGETYDQRIRDVQSLLRSKGFCAVPTFPAVKLGGVMYALRPDMVGLSAPVVTNSRPEMGPLPSDIKVIHCRFNAQECCLLPEDEPSEHWSQGCRTCAECLCWACFYIICPWCA